MNNIVCVSVKITIILIVLVGLLLLKNNDNFEGSLKNAHKNFLKHPGEKKYCPSMTQNEATTFFPIPNSNLKLKLCCNSCFHSIIEELEIQGEYQIDKFNENDIENLNKFYQKNNLSFPFPKNKLNGFIGKECLKKKNMVVQIL